MLFIKRRIKPDLKDDKAVLAVIFVIVQQTFPMLPEKG